MLSKIYKRNMQVMSNSNTVKSFVLQTLFITGKEKIMMNAAVNLI